jgi:GWxTD domain-containing protein
MYRRAGLIAEGPPFPFTGIIRFFPTGRPDSTLVLLSLSLSNRSLTFVAEGNDYRAGYRVGVAIRQDTGSGRQLDSREMVRVSAFRETSRGDESIVFQRFFVVPPGSIQLSISMRDEGSPRAGSTALTIQVPGLTPGKLSSPVIAHEATGRTSFDSLPRVIANPRATVVFGRDSSALLYVEAQQITTDAGVTITAFSERGAQLWKDTVTLSAGALVPTTLRIPVSNIGAGAINLALSIIGSSDTVRTPLLVSFGDEWTITSYTEMLEYLRYFATPEELQTLRDARPENRAVVWTTFWRATDPVPTTADNEALRDYFGRVRVANERFGEEGGPGWLTDRGRVLLTLGDPDQIYEQQEMSVRQGGRAQIWLYTRHRVRLVFVDQSGFGRWRLTMASEVDLQNAARDRRR